MVFFVCSKCGTSLKKNQVAKHTFQCRSSSFSCIDCNKDFFGDDYKAHTKCISEVERYSAKGWVPPANHNKGEKKQNEWMDIVQATLDKHANSISPSCRNLLHTISKHDNVPRKKPKFINFINNVCRRGFNDSTISEVWMVLEAEWKASKPPVTPKDVPPADNGKVVDNGNMINESDGKKKKKRKKEAETDEELDVRCNGQKKRKRKKAKRGTEDE